MIPEWYYTCIRGLKPAKTIRGKEGGGSEFKYDGVPNFDNAALPKT